MTLVRLTAQNDDLTHTKIGNLNIYFYNTNSVFQTSGITDNAGLAQFNLPDGTYDLLFYKTGVTVTQPQRIVVDANLQNNFLITGHTKTAPESLDPLLCRISGYINGIDNKPLKDISVNIGQIPLNIINTGRHVFNSPVEFTSDADGYFEFDLLRNVKYEAHLDNYPYALPVKTANTPAVNLSDLLFPIPVSLSLSSTVASLALGSTNTSITYSVMYSDYNLGLLENEWSSVQIDYTVPGIAKVSATDTNLFITPIASGVTVASFSRVFSTRYQWINPQSFVAPTLTITVY